MKDVYVPTSHSEAITEEQFRDIVAADLDGNEEATAYLEHDVDEWFRGLQEMFLSIEAQFAKRKGDALAYQQESMRSGTKREWFDYKAEYDQWRGRTNHFKRIVQARLSEVRDMRRSVHQSSDNGNFGSLLREIIERLERIEKLMSL